MLYFISQHCWLAKISGNKCDYCCFSAYEVFLLFFKKIFENKYLSPVGCTHNFSIASSVRKVRRFDFGSRVMVVIKSVCSFLLCLFCQVAPSTITFEEKSYQKHCKAYTAQMEIKIL